MGDGRRKYDRLLIANVLIGSTGGTGLGKHLRFPNLRSIRIFVKGFIFFPFFDHFHIYQYILSVADGGPKNAFAYFSSSGRARFQMSLERDDDCSSFHCKKQRTAVDLEPMRPFVRLITLAGPSTPPE
jgi:hypothetical protein